MSDGISQKSFHQKPDNQEYPKVAINLINLYHRTRLFPQLFDRFLSSISHLEGIHKQKTFWLEFRLLCSLHRKLDKSKNQKLLLILIFLDIQSFFSLTTGKKSLGISEFPQHSLFLSFSALIHASEIW